MSTTLRPWLHQYITALPKPGVPLPPAASLQITDYSTEPPNSPSDLPRVTAIVSDGYLRIRAPVDEAALRAVRDSTPLPQWRGAIVALDQWTLSYTLDEFVLQLHAFHILQAVGSSDIGSARHCMDDQQVRHTHAVIRQANVQQRHRLLQAQHSKLFPNQPLPPTSYSLAQPIPAELAALRLPSAELSFLYSVPEPCQQEMDRLPPKEGAGVLSVAGVGEPIEASGAGLSQWSDGSDGKEEKEQDQVYFSQYAGIRPPAHLPTYTSASPLFPPLISVAPLANSAPLTSTSTATSAPMHSACAIDHCAAACSVAFHTSHSIVASIPVNTAQCHLFAVVPHSVTSSAATVSGATLSCSVCLVRDLVSACRGCAEHAATSQSAQHDGDIAGT